MAIMDKYSAKKYYKLSMSKCALLCILLTFFIKLNANPIEAGAVKWSEDFELAKKQSAETGRPIFLLFQEIPG